MPHKPGLAPAAAARSGRLTVGRLAPVVAIGLVAVVVFAMGWHRQLSLETLVRHRAALDDFVDMHFAAALTAFVAIYVMAVSLSLPGALFLTISGGLLFGAVIGGTAAVVGATAGATVILLIPLSAFGEYVLRRAGPPRAQPA